jgi:hypothetical protein
MNWFKNKKTLIITDIYYGPKDIKAVVSELQKNPIPAKFCYCYCTKRIQTKKQSSSFADYDMVQAETRWIKTDKYDAKQNT